MFRRRRPLRQRLRLSEERQSTVWRRGFWSAQVGSGAWAAREGTHGKRRSPCSGGALRLPFRRLRSSEGRRATAQAPVGRLSRRVPRRVSWVAPLPLGSFGDLRPAKARCFPPAPPNYPEPSYNTPTEVSVSRVPLQPRCNTARQIDRCCISGPPYPSGKGEESRIFAPPPIASPLALFAFLLFFPSPPLLRPSFLIPNLS